MINKQNLNGTTLSWPAPEVFKGENDGLFCKVVIDDCYFDNNGFIKDDFLKTISNRLDINKDKLKMININGEIDNNFCYKYDFNDGVLNLYFMPIFVSGYDNSFFEITTGTEVLPCNMGNNIVAKGLLEINMEEFNNFLKYIDDEKNKEECDLYMDSIINLKKKNKIRNRK